MATTSSYQWRFFRAGGFDQVKLETGADLMALDQLDLKLWVALACPVSGLEFDKTTLTMMDTDKDGRVRAPELLEAVKWAGGLLNNPDDLMKGSPTLKLRAINESTPTGKAIATFARQILGKGENDEITISEGISAAQTFAAKAFNGDGVITEDSAADESTKAALKDIITCLGSDPDASGKPGISQARIDQFFADATAYSDWWKKAEGNDAILPLGLETNAAAAGVKAVQAKVDDFFARCRLAAYDPRSVAALNRDEKEYLILAAKDMSATHADIAHFPLAPAGANQSLPLIAGINPAWTTAMNTFRTAAVKPLLGGEKAALTEAEWAALTAKLAGFDSWSASKAGGSVEKIGLKRVREILGSKAKDNLTALIAKDKAEEANAKSVAGLNQLVHYHRDLAKLCNNYVSFRDFYGRKDKAIFQAGTLYLDQRSCDLCLTVEDQAKHSAMAGMAGTYLAYCECYRKGSNEKMQIVAAFTAGDSDNLMVGRNGIFFDRKGRDWDATITKIIDNPISIRQAFFSPYKKLVRMIEENVAKRAAAADAATNTQLAANVQAVAKGEATKPGEPKKIDTGTLAAIGLVLTTLLGALGAIFGKIFGLLWWQVPLALIAILLAVSAPSMLIAYLKLRKRNLGPILDANGWAVNARAKMNVPFGGSLTSIATLPAGSQRDLADPFAEKKSPWPKIILVLIILGLALVVLNKLGLIYKWSGGHFGHNYEEKQDESEKKKDAPEK
jgi:hypothetical protein